MKHPWRKLATAQDKQRQSSFFKLDGSPNARVVRRAAATKTKVLARKLRRSQTPTEAKVWGRLHALSLRFRRQSVILGWIADFYHAKSRLVIEIDGGYHNEPAQRERDHHRDSVMKAHGFKVLRISSDRVNSDFDSVISDILQAIAAISDQQKAAEPEACGRRAPSREVTGATKA